MNITFIGGGNMAGAIIGGLRKRGFATSQFRIVEIDPEKRRSLENQGYRCFEPGHAYEAIDDDTVIVLAVKPQQLSDAVSRLGNVAQQHQCLVISILAGVQLRTIGERLGGHARLIRAMPNLPALIGAGITAYYAAGSDITQEDVKQTEVILSAIGETVRVQDEGQLNAVTAVSGSGPAYVFYFLEAAAQAGEALGLPPETARRLAVTTFSGASRLASESSNSLAALREQVTSKGGTTERALASMERDGVKAAIVRAIHAANERARELGDELARS